MDQEIDFFKTLDDSDAAAAVDTIKDELCTFVDSIDADGGGGGVTTATTTKGNRVTEDSSSSDNIWWTLSNAFESWQKCLVDVEVRVRDRSTTTKQRIDETIYRMLEDGLIGTCHASELRYTGESWTRLMNAYACYSVGCLNYKQDIIATLLDLFTAKQIARELFIEICSQL